MSIIPITATRQQNFITLFRAQGSGCRVTGEKGKITGYADFSHPMGKSRHVGDDTCAGALVMGG